MKKGLFYAILCFILIAVIKIELYAQDSDLKLKMYKNGKYGYENDDGTRKIDAIFDYAEEFSCGRALISTKDKYAYINNKGKVVIPPTYEKAETFVNNLAKVQSGLLTAYIDTSGNRISSKDYFTLGNFSDHRAKFLKWNKYGYVDYKCKQGIKPVYDNAFDFKNHTAIVKYKGWFGVIDTAANTIVDFEYDTIISYTNNAYLAISNGIYKYIKSPTALSQNNSSYYRPKIEMEQSVGDFKIVVDDIRGFVKIYNNKDTMYYDSGTDFCTISHQVDVDSVTEVISKELNQSSYVTKLASFYTVPKMILEVTVNEHGAVADYEVLYFFDDHIKNITIKLIEKHFKKLVSNHLGVCVPYTFQLRFKIE